MPYTYEYPRGALTVDCVVFGLDEEDRALLQKTAWEVCRPPGRKKATRG